MPIKTCLFDMGDVLVRFCHDTMCRQIGALCGLSGPETRGLLIDSGLQWDFERGRIDERGLHDRLQRVTGTSIDFAALKVASGDIFSPQPGIEPVIASLAESGTRLVLLSNTCVTHFDFVRAHYPFMDRFDAFVLSYEVGAIKPEAGMYEAALTAIDCDPTECFYTDDRPENIEASRPYGFDAELFTDVDSLRAQLEGRRATVES